MNRSIVSTCNKCGQCAPFGRRTRFQRARYRKRYIALALRALIVMLALYPPSSHSEFLACGEREELLVAKIDGYYCTEFICQVYISSPSAHDGNPISQIALLVGEPSHPQLRTRLAYVVEEGLASFEIQGSSSELSRYTVRVGYLDVKGCTKWATLPIPQYNKSGFGTR